MSELRLDALKQERRRLPRKRVVRRAKIVYGDGGAYTADCLIRNMTDGSARIAVDKGVSMPTHVYLIDISAGLAYAAEVVSIRAPSFGLKLLRTYRLAELVDPNLKDLKHCWVNCAR